MMGLETFHRLESDLTDGSMRMANDRRLEVGWWAARGIEIEALEAWTLEQAMEDLERLLAVGGTLPVEFVAGALSTAYHMGVLMGVRLTEAR